MGRERGWEGVERGGGGGFPLSSTEARPEQRAQGRRGEAGRENKQSDGC